MTLVSDTLIVQVVKKRTTTTPMPPRRRRRRRRGKPHAPPHRSQRTHAETLALARQCFLILGHTKVMTQVNVNDPSAGSPTETLLRLLLPLNATVWSSSRQPGRVIRQANSPRTSLKRSIGSSDGRCVQRAGT